MLNGLLQRIKVNFMQKILPNQVYAGLHEILKNNQLYYRSSIGTEYCHLTEEGKEAVIKWIELMGPHMYKLEEQELDARAKKMVWNELKR